MHCVLNDLSHAYGLEMDILVEYVNKYVIINEVCSPERSVNDVEYEFVSPSIGQRKSCRTLVFLKSTE